MFYKPETSLRHIVAVVGSANMDLSIQVPRLPLMGETILGGDMITNPGGKGANQAVAAQRASLHSGDCRFIGRVGADIFGSKVRDVLSLEAIDTHYLIPTADTPTGIASVMVNSEGDNAIVVSPGANARLTPDDIHAAQDSITTAKVLVVQLEIPFETVAAALKLAREAGVLTILDPAPAPQPTVSGSIALLPDALWDVDIFTPNQTEAHLLTGIEVTDIASAFTAGERLLQHGPKTVVLKLGEMGSAIVTHRSVESGEFVELTHIPAMTVSVADTTAAGDSFTGALAAFIAQGITITEAVRLAGIAGSLACTRLGAQVSIPSRSEIFVSKVNWAHRESDTTGGSITCIHIAKPSS